MTIHANRQIMPQPTDNVAEHDAVQMRALFRLPREIRRKSIRGRTSSKNSVAGDEEAVYKEYGDSSRTVYFDILSDDRVPIFLFAVSHTTFDIEGSTSHKY